MANQAKSIPPVQRLIARVTGARLCFGRPVSANGRTVIPVAGVRTAGGGGFGRAPGSGDSGGGGGGALEARPIGFIEISPEGTRFERIDDGRTALRAIAAGSFAVLVAGRVASRRRRQGPPRPTLPEVAIAAAAARRRGRRGRRHVAALELTPPPRGGRWRQLRLGAARPRQLRRIQSSQRS
jgi:hypothetical protein